MINLCGQATPIWLLQSVTQVRSTKIYSWMGKITFLLLSQLKMNDYSWITTTTAISDLMAQSVVRPSDIRLLSLSPHTSHRMQPFGLTDFVSLESAYNRDCGLFMATNTILRITHYEIVDVFTKLFNQYYQKRCKRIPCTWNFAIRSHKFEELFQINIFECCCWMKCFQYQSSKITSVVFSIGQ